jgi:hypothetical protein
MIEVEPGNGVRVISAFPAKGLVAILNLCATVKRTRCAPKKAPPASPAVSFNKPVHFLQLTTALLQLITAHGGLFGGNNSSSQPIQQASR